MTQPAERRFVMEPRLDAEVETINDALATKVDTTDARLSDQRVPTDNSVTSAKIVNGAIVDADINASAAIARTKIDGVAVSQADTGSVTSTMILDGTIVNGDINASAAIAFSKLALPTADVDVNTHKVINVVDPTSAQDAATKAYVDSLVASGTTTGARAIAVKNGASSLTKGQPVYASGADGTNIIISAAGNGSEATSSKTLGLVQTALSANAMGFVVTQGLLSGLDTSGASAAGDAVWLGPSGTLLYGLAAKPVAPAHLVYIGIVTKKNASTGEIYVNPQNGFELDELHNVLITSPTNGQALTYETSSGLWKNATPVNSLSGLSDVAITSPTGGQVIKYDSTATKWINGPAAGGVTAAASAPSLSTAAAGDAWFDTNDGTLYVCYVDTDSTKQWVQVQANSALEGSILARLGSLESQAIAFGALSPNYIINGGFDINQRGLTSSPGGGAAWCSDRWQSSGMSSSNIYDLAAGDLVGTGLTKFLRMSRTSNVGNYPAIETHIEDVRTVPTGVPVTLSFYAKQNTAWNNGTWYVGWYQSFGTGGSAGNGNLTVQAISLTSSWARYSFTFTMDSVSGKTIGANSYLNLLLRNNGNAQTAGEIDITGIQLERGSMATSFRRNAPSIEAELAACQRYYWKWIGASSVGLTSVNFWTNNDSVGIIKLPTTMRIAPTPTLSAASTWNVLANGTNLSVSTPDFISVTPDIFSLRMYTASGGTAGTGGLLRSAAGSTSTIEFSAEL